MIFALTLEALASVICPSIAASIRMSHGSSSSSALVIRSPCFESRKLGVCAFCSMISPTSSPESLYTPPDASLNAIILHPCSCSILAATDPTFPNPCTATLAPSNGTDRCAAVSRAMFMQPRPVDSVLPLVPPTLNGLPVTTPGTE